MQLRTLAAVLVACLLAGATLASAGGKKDKETAWCREQREQCEAGYPKDAKIDFSCKDKKGARSVGCSCASTDGSSTSASSSSSSFSGSSFTAV
jgi:hypothetical protein